MTFPTRRQFLSLFAAYLSSGPLVSHAEDHLDNLPLGTSHDFSWAGLLEHARKTALQPYQAPISPEPGIIERIDWDAHGQIQFNMDHALFADGPGDYPIAFFHPGKFFPFPVHMYRLEQALTDRQSTTQAQEILFNKKLFHMPANSPAQELNQPVGFAGFRIQENREGTGPNWRSNDWAAFLGASYFRAIGDEYQYGISARGVSINTLVDHQKEEFPLFTHFYFEPPQPGSHDVSLYALLDGPSLTGAYHFIMSRGNGVTTEVEAELFLRRDISRFGLAPMTSMYWFSDKDKRFQEDWRPEVHDSDGLSMWTGNDEHLWRPLINPRETDISYFSDENPKGFGLMQRERHFSQYQDAVHYEKRPGLWVEPLNAWGKGTVQLIELHTEEELYDNVVAAWVPDQPARAGSHHHLHYRLYWQTDTPFPNHLARCIGTHIGRGGEPAHRPADSHKFEVTFSGGDLFHLAEGSIPEAVVTPSRGHVANVACEAVPNGEPGQWRALFDLTGLQGRDPVDIRLFLRQGTNTLSETWLYHFLPA
ncbi:MAG: glucan biosynthesis protein D [Betaproteobacteria bacterium]|jgi:Periplasmic glucans biosynthesis protein|nr:glucan biosynthesis protein D [Betaproteobacteria bacterium]